MARGANATRHILLVTAEQMFGELGIDGVSLLAIAKEAGQGNKNAVQYHFGSKAGLILAIIQSRAAMIEKRRAELTIEAVTSGKASDVNTLARAMFLPVVEQTNDAGEYSFARFLLQYLNHPGQPEALLGTADIDRDQSVTEQLRELLRRAIPHASAELVAWRVLMQLRLLLACLVEHEDALRRGEARMSKEQLINETFNMVVAGLSASA